MRQVDALGSAVKEYQETLGHPPPADQLGHAIYFDPEEAFSKLPPERQDVQYAIQAIIDGAMQMAASRLLDQSTHRTNGEDRIREGIRAFEAAKERNKK
jgi:hypothetical protein